MTPTTPPTCASRATSSTCTASSTTRLRTCRTRPTPSRGEGGGHRELRGRQARAILQVLSPGIPDFACASLLFAHQLKTSGPTACRRSSTPILRPSQSSAPPAPSCRYIRYARAIKPQVNREAADKLVRMYKELRGEDAAPGTQSAYRITVRTVLATLRCILHHGWDCSSSLLRSSPLFHPAYLPGPCLLGAC